LHHVTLSLHSWGQIFGNPNEAVAADMPLWVTQNDYDPHLGKFTPFGGWRFATGKQWNISTNYMLPNPTGPCGGDVDQDTFAFQQDDIQIPSQKLGPKSCKTTIDGLRYRTCPYTTSNCVAMGQIPLGMVVSFTCQTHGQLISGNWNTEYDDQRKFGVRSSQLTFSPFKFLGQN
jgi:hypothetical protein